MRDLASAEHDRHLHLVILLQEPQHVALLRLVVVRGDLRAQLHLTYGHLLLVLARLLATLLLLVLVLRVVEHAAHRRLGSRRDLDEIEIPLARIGECIVALHYSDLLAVVTDEAHLRHPDALVDTRRVPLRRAPIEPAWDRHYRMAELACTSPSAARDRQEGRRGGKATKREGTRRLAATDLRSVGALHCGRV